MPSNGNSEDLPPPPAGQDDVLIDAWREALGGVLAEQQRHGERAVELIEAHARAAIAELRADSAALRRELEAAVVARLASLRDGAEGRQGERGEAGQPGPPGPAGNMGEPGPAGPAGEPGPSGPPGERGPAGPPGERGEPGEPGPIGARGEIGPDGPQGVAGEPGEPGPAGPAGPQGAQGAQGLGGPDGPAGVRGESGPAGPAGLAGVRGEIGPAGPQGLEGKPGKLPLAKSWLEGVHYEGEVVTHAGGTYQARRDTGRPPGGDDWIVLAAPGRPARSPKPCGTFDPEATYCELEIVALNGGSFIALKDNPGPCPGEGWQLLTRQGQRGVAGPRGERGERGERGIAPLPARIADWKVDREKYTAIPKMSDGTEGPALELRALFEQFQEETG